MMRYECENEDSSPSTLCRICETNLANAAVYSCAHQYYCYECLVQWSVGQRTPDDGGRKMASCPTCRRVGRITLFT